MELDDLKQAFARLDRRLEEQNAVNVAQVRRDARNRLQDSIRPLGRAQTWQIVAGAATAFIGVAVWHGTRDTMGGPFVSGVILHLYGIAMIIFGAVTKALIGAIDWAGPVLGIQRRLARVRKAQVLAGIVIGLSWCVLWIPAMIALFQLLFGIDIVAPSPSTWLWLSAGGVALMGAVGLFQYWARATGRTAIAAAFDSAFTGEHLGRAQAELDAIQRFERD
ncbi:MAG TPA: hypothetical protein VLK25_01980 [Allosphingosinicella sp.]|nr:hypothetical protein [Allosphingosinicella sp.]